MPTFTVHEPRPRKGESAASPERFVFVRDGFYFWAFAVSPLWLLLRRLWLVFVLYLLAVIAINVGLFFLNAPGVAKFAVSFLISLLIGFEAGTLWRWTLARRKAKTVGVVVAEDLEMAERRFFAAWTERQTPVTSAKSEPQYSTPVRRGPPTGSDVIGLFPEPGGSR
jgi:hypothetical protein